jgi:two-component system response regulator RegX3
VLTSHPSGPGNRDDGPVGIAPSGGLAPAASHGNPTMHHSSAGEAVQPRCRSHSAPVRHRALRLHPVPESHGPAMTLAFHEVETGVLPPEGHPTILIIDDDPASRDWLAATLSVEGFDVVTADGGAEGIARVRSVDAALILLNMQLVDSQGLSVFRTITSLSSVPVIMVTDRDDEIDAVLSLEAGAADHITKPPRPRELTARIRAVLRRVGRPEAGPVRPPAPVDVFTLGPVCIDLSRRQANVRGLAAELSRKEFDLLALLVSEAGHVVTRQQCMERIWRDKLMGDSRTLDTHVKRLRKKVERHPAEPEHVLTVRGIGYRFNP